jgi:hypothetical protein
MHSSRDADKTSSRRAFGRFASKLGGALCLAVDAARERMGRVIEAARVFETAPPSVHVVAAAIVGAAPSALPHVSGVILGPAVKVASQTMVALIAAHASATVFQRAGHRVSTASILREAVARNRDARRIVTPRATLCFGVGRLSACALDLVPGIGATRRIFEATAGALAAARFVALAEQHAEACVRARATRLVEQDAVNDNDAPASIPSRARA